MSTRSVIARPTATGFEGTYHHWDGYPSGLGCTLWTLYREHFKRNLNKMTRFLIDEHPAGWSSINGADFSLPAGAYNREGTTGSCKHCGRVHAWHYRQYYNGEGNNPRPDQLPPREGWNGPDGYLVFNHSFEQTDFEAHKPHGPICSCHDERGHKIKGEKSWTVTERNASGSGCEWAYVLVPAQNGTPDTMRVFSSYCDPEGKYSGEKMIGAFGCGDERAVWREVAAVDLTTETEPDWAAIQGFPS